MVIPVRSDPRLLNTNDDSSVLNMDGDSSAKQLLKTDGDSV